VVRVSNSDQVGARAGREQFGPGQRACRATQFEPGWHGVRARAIQTRLARRWRESRNTAGNSRGQLVGERVVSTWLATERHRGEDRHAAITLDVR